MYRIMFLNNIHSDWEYANNQEYKTYAEAIEQVKNYNTTYKYLIFKITES